MIKLLTHNDLDGVSCYILAQLLINDEVEVEFCTHQTIEEKLSETILELEKYEMVYLTDIHVSLAYVHQFFTPEVVKKVRIFDHHQTGTELNHYDFAQVVTYYNNRLTCGTELFFKYLTQKNSAKHLNKFVELVRSYDTWDWFKEDNKEAKDLNDLFYIKGISVFVKQIEESLKESTESLFTEVDRILLDSEHKRIEKYIKKKMKEMKIIDIDGYTAGVVLAESYLSELGNELAKKYQDLDFIAMVTYGNISYRTCKENVDVGSIAKKLGGGGHRKAAGSPISRDIQNEYYKKLFKIKSEEE